MNPRLRKALIIIGIVTIIIIAIVLVPRGLSVYFQARGGQQIEYVLRFEEGIDELVCEELSSANPGDLDEINMAINNLSRAINLNRANSQAYYYLGKANCLLGESEKAIGYYIQFTKLRPGNPVGYIGLGFAYEKAGNSISADDAWNSAGLRTEDFLEAGIDNYRAGNFDNAANWIERANRLSGFQLDKKPSNGEYIIFESFLNTKKWEECVSCNNVTGIFQVRDGVLELTYDNELIKRDNFAIVSYPNLPLYFYDELILRMRADKGTLLTLELVIDGERLRPIEYEELSNDWVELSVPVKGVTLNEIGLSISEIDSSALPSKYRLFVDWITLK